MNNEGTVLITGATSGIGYELAQIFAFHKYNLILVSRNTGKLTELADKLANEYNIKIDIIGQDLSQQGATKKLALVKE
ncbi:SDR family NAD(P)-dependent oxidoreductase [Clostridium sp. OS1-26]|uniref:SDR family NAD(P)-dependent oxidoreductase n=1 Tax=Clostridium sp. OS1-26 TaxID=3070681 RepID=UPI0027E0E419|nr:SDR family NAD(P)-dependent oxidoreductase [Clostridium sp. OS1-26]WML32790.1 SDR family NAD(P)-dependent oxidoreductase [Clostridium sp. OS1-26]